MEKKYKRTKFFVNPSIQAKYIALSILPALVISLFCSYFLIRFGEMIIKTEKESHFADISEITQTIYTINTEECTGDAPEKIKMLMADLLPLQSALAMSQFDTLAKWSKVKFILLFGLLLILLCIGVLALLASHRVAGPIVRLKNAMDALAQEKDIPPVRLRKDDELKELAESLEKLRTHLKGKGVLE